MYHDLPRRERQSMDVVYRLGRATVASIRAALQDSPGYSAVPLYSFSFRERFPMKSSIFCLLAVPLFTLGCAQARQTTSENPLPSEYSEWVDPSPHRSGYVTGGDVRLHYLDWGGEGETIVLLPGLSSSAHAFDEIAPKLTDRFHVLGLTPRAHGESSTPDTTYTVTDAAEDIRLLLDSLGIEQAHLVGHSISGSAITRFAALHPDRVGKLIYLDATFDYGGAEQEEMDAKALSRPWPEGGAASVGEYRDLARHYFYGTWSPALEADMWSGNSATREENERRGKARAALLADAISQPKEYAQVSAPALSLWAQKTMQTHYQWVDRADADAVARAEEYLRLRRLWEQSGVDRFQREMPAGRTVAFPGHHWMFVTDEEHVLGEIRSFLLAR